jgi:inner membrane protein
MQILSVRPVLVGLLALGLFIPVGMIQGLVAERQARSNEAIDGIAKGWGGRQTLTGPSLVVPYSRTRGDKVEQLQLRLPAESVQWSLEARVGEKSRGLYKARLYAATALVKGRFTVPAHFGVTGDKDTRISLHTPRLSLGVSDPRGIRGAERLTLDGKTWEFSPGSGDQGVAGGVHAPLPGLDPAQRRTLEFSFSIEVAGSQALSVAPQGSDASVTLRADWPHPSFQGEFLPARYEPGAQGFLAHWRISPFASQSSQVLGVSFIEPAGLYQRLERASKYGFLFIGLTFAAFLLVEMLRRLAIHPAQYALVGLALAMFFLLLTALSEHITFLWAYLAAALACVGLITAYLVRVLQSARLGLAFGAALGGLYAILYALLKAEDHALLGGALLLFGLLAAVMLATRKVDWYALGSAR